MKVTRSQLKRIIKEEVLKIREAPEKRNPDWGSPEQSGWDRDRLWQASQSGRTKFPVKSRAALGLILNDMRKIANGTLNDKSIAQYTEIYGEPLMKEIIKDVSNAKRELGDPEWKSFDIEELYAKYGKRILAIHLDPQSPWGSEKKQYLSPSRVIRVRQQGSDTPTPVKIDNPNVTMNINNSEHQRYKSRAIANTEKEDLPLLQKALADGYYVIDPLDRDEFNAYVERNVDTPNGGEPVVHLITVEHPRGEGRIIYFKVAHSRVYGKLEVGTNQ